jgi:hypothetical protein
MTASSSVITSCARAASENGNPHKTPIIKSKAIIFFADFTLFPRSFSIPNSNLDCDIRQTLSNKLNIPKSSYRNIAAFSLFTLCP